MDERSIEAKNVNYKNSKAAKAPKQEWIWATRRRRSGSDCVKRRAENKHDGLHNP